ncbi:MAG TPA: hypothetical protein VGW35_22850 [Methylomirabilota bacterium]|nr:hypothetical protein [Methylomirabilota bacterium]
MTRRLRVPLAALAALAVAVAGCAPAPLIFRVEPGLPSAAEPGRLDDYASAVRTLAGIMVAELGLPLPRDLTVIVYPSRAAYARGLPDMIELTPPQAGRTAKHSVGLGQHRRLFINDEALRGARPAARLGVVAHELTHVAQYELSGGRRGRSEQWLREGMAEWVAGWMIERLGEGTFLGERDAAVRALAQDRWALEAEPLGLEELGRPWGWEARRRRAGDHLPYRLAFLLTDALIRRHGLGSLLAYFRSFAEVDDRFGNFRRAFGLSLEVFESEALGRIRAELALDSDP